ncbi:XrtA-associated tyrosine autokinase [Halochromatium glycolicum]|uniref:Protein tyrosine kinase n=1 Tax=Halochromatium glycolicum TaxID=85075 RepID=A0AAJ0U7I5_9GAMM|nr:XrtA-associated tyrosine autokinase [Halochromatium glycolicum]MBK1706648.1 protein tyrosine kinase [Halochromatium glycolicum]
MTKENDDSTSLIEQAARRLSEQASGSYSEPAVASASAAPEIDDHDLDHGDQVNIDLVSLKTQGYVTPDADRTRVAEEFRIIKRPLLENAFGRTASLVEQGNLIMVTSSLPGEGKTYSAINLAMSIAMEMDKTVLLVDADVGRARLHRALEIPSGPGLIDLLLKPSLDAGDVMLRTNVPKLRIITRGEYHPRANELLASGDMQRLVREFANRYEDRIIIFDAPPLLVTSEAVVLSGLVGQIVFVVEAHKSLQHTVKDALGLLDTSKPIGLVLNKARSFPGASYFGYGGYGYGYNYGPDGAGQ